MEGARRRVRPAFQDIGRRLAAGEKTMAWTRPKIREICIGMEINGYLPAEL
jgi:coenzyme PQQ precursor peptide PqqA